MQILGNIFNAIIFVSAMAVYFVFYLFLSQSYPALYAAPMVSALRYDPFLRSIPFTEVFLISPETQEWLNGFYIACWIWVCGVLVFFRL